MVKNVTEEKLGGAKRKNGHKSDCTCHICENMKNKARRGGYEEEEEKERERIAGGSKKKNGHRINCTCPICKNMKNAKNEKNDNNEDNEKNDKPVSQKKKSNGHKLNCQCPICKNMSKSKKGGSEEPDIENQKGDIEEASIKANSNLKDDSIPEETSTKALEIPASDSDYDALDQAELGQAGTNVVGGTRRRRKSRRARRTRRRRARRHSSRR